MPATGPGHKGLYSTATWVAEEEGSLIQALLGLQSELKEVQATFQSKTKPSKPYKKVWVTYTFFKYSLKNILRLQFIGEIFPSMYETPGKTPIAQAHTELIDLLNLLQNTAF